MNPKKDTAPTSKVPIQRSSLPRSVRGASPHLRALIRKNQNAESARRSRRKRRLQRQLEAKKNDPRTLPLRLQKLDNVLITLEERVEDIEEICNGLLDRNPGVAQVSTRSTNSSSVIGKETENMSFLFR